jgi:RHS repeat-associated protein
MTKSYHTIDGIIIGESSGGVRTGYLPDALGNVTATVQDGAIVNAYRYKPSGGLLSKTGAGADPKFMWTGTSGSRATGVAHAEQYNRHRHYGNAHGSWISQDPFWPEELAYIYARSNPTNFTDPFGLTSSCPNDPCDCVAECDKYEKVNKVCERPMPSPPYPPNWKYQYYAFCCDGEPCYCTCPGAVTTNSILKKCLGAHELAHCPPGACVKGQIGLCRPKPDTGTECAAIMAEIRCIEAACPNNLGNGECWNATLHKCELCRTNLKYACKPGWIPQGFKDKYRKGCSL